MTDPDLGETLTHAGGAVVQEGADAEIAGSEDALSGDAPYVVVTLGRVPHEGGSRILRVARRTLRSLRLRAQAARSRRSVQRRGYPTTWTILWEWEHAVRVPSLQPRTELGWREHLPLNALVVGSRRDRPPTVLDASLAGAAEQVGAPLEAAWPVATQAGLVTIAPEGVLRVAVGPAARLLERQREVLTTLAGEATDETVSTRAPAILAHGKTALGTWTLEQRLPGSSAPPGLSDRLLDDCVDFLLALHKTGDNSTPAGAPSRQAEVVARAALQERAALVRWLGERAEEVLAGIPRVFAHGDFWSQNLLVQDNHLAGVVDWDNGGPGRLPFLDLIQLRINMVRAGTKQFLGPAIVDYLLPWAKAGGDDVTRAYASRLGVTTETSLLEALVVAYWLDRIGHELESHSDRAQRPVWMHRNVEFVLQGIVAEAVLEPPVPELTSS